MKVFEDRRFLILFVINTFVSILLFVGFRFGGGADWTDYVHSMYQFFNPELYGRMSSYYGPLFILFIKFFFTFTPGKYIYLKLIQHFLGFLCPIIVYFALKRINLNFAFAVSLASCLDINQRVFFTLFATEPLFIFFITLLLYSVTIFITSKRKSDIILAFYLFVPVALATLTRAAATYLPLILIPFSYIFKGKRVAIYLLILVIFIYSSVEVYKSSYHLLEPSKDFMVFHFYLLRGMVNRSNGKYTQQLGNEVNKRFYASAPTATEIEHFWKDLEKQPGIAQMNYSRVLALGVLGTRERPPNRKLESLMRRAILEGFLAYPTQTVKGMIWALIKFSAFRTEFENTQFGKVLYPKYIEGIRNKSEIRKMLHSERWGQEMMVLPRWVVTPIRNEFHNLMWSPVRIQPLKEEEYIVFYDRGNLPIMKIFEYFNRIMDVLINLLIFIVSPILLILCRRRIRDYLRESNPLIIIMSFSLFLISFFSLMLMTLEPLDRFRAPLGAYYFIIIFGLIKIFWEEYGRKLDEWKERLFGLAR